MAALKRIFVTTAEISIDLEDETATAALGARLAALLRSGDVVRLSGDLGAGKSTLARGVISALAGVKEAPSPTFTFVETYETPSFLLWHFDLYRLEQPGDVWELGLEEALEDGAVLIEWPERIEEMLGREGLLIRLEIIGGARKARLCPDASWKDRLSKAGIA